LDYNTVAAQLRIDYLGGVPKIHRYSVLDLFGGGQLFGVFNCTLHNLIRAVSERVFQVNVDGRLCPPPRPTVDVPTCFANFYAEFQDRAFTTARLPLEDVPLLYKGRKRTIYENAVKSLNEKPLTIQDSYIRAFGKVEKLCLSTKKFSDVVMRVIQPRTPRYGVQLARYIKPIEHKVYDIVDSMFADRQGVIRPGDERTIMKGLNARDVAKTIVQKVRRYKDFVFIGMDAKRFDQHTSVPMLKYEHSIYQLFYRNGPRNKSRFLEQLLEMQLTNRGYGYFPEGKLKYVNNGGRMSGDMNTGLGNCLIMCTMLWTYFNSLGIEYDAINNGDDCGIIMSVDDYERYFDRDDCSSFFLSLGYRMEIEDPIYEIEGIEFCQCHPVCVDGNWIMVRNVDAAVSKDCMSVETLGNIHKWVQHWGDVGKCGLAMSSGVPMNQVYYQRLVQLAEMHRPRNFSDSKNYMNTDYDNQGFYNMAKGLTHTFIDVSDSTRVSFYNAFGILPDMQIEMEKTYATLYVNPMHVRSLEYEVVRTNFR
jgi:hypothetical protein